MYRIKIYQSLPLLENGQCDLDLLLPLELRDRSRNVGDDDEEQELRLVEGVKPNIS